MQIDDDLKDVARELADAVNLSDGTRLALNLCDAREAAYLDYCRRLADGWKAPAQLPREQPLVDAVPLRAHEPGLTASQAAQRDYVARLVSAHRQV